MTCENRSGHGHGYGHGHSFNLDREHGIIALPLGN
jgi:hypothetical protein